MASASQILAVDAHIPGKIHISGPGRNCGRSRDCMRQPIAH